MAAQQGFIYEQNAVNYLKELNLSDGIIAGASHNRPDLMLTVKDKKAGCELKITNTAGGSLVIHYYNKKNPHWQLGETENNPEKEFLKEIAKKSGAMRIIEREWETPWLQKDASEAWKKEMLKYTLRSRYQRDLESCPNKYIKLAPNVMEQYYNHKNTYYINIGTHGFFLLGSTDPLNLNKNCRKKNIDQIPLFSSAVEMRARIRTQSKGITAAETREDKVNNIGAQGYQFTFTLEFVMRKKSPYNIAPITGDNNVSIQRDKANLKCLII